MKPLLLRPIAIVFVIAAFVPADTARKFVGLWLAVLFAGLLWVLGTDQIMIGTVTQVGTQVADGHSIMTLVPPFADPLRVVLETTSAVAPVDLENRWVMVLGNPIEGSAEAPLFLATKDWAVPSVTSVLQSIGYMPTWAGAPRSGLALAGAIMVILAPFTARFAVGAMVGAITAVALATVLPAAVHLGWLDLPMLAAWPFASWAGLLVAALAFRGSSDDSHDVLGRVTAVIATALLGPMFMAHFGLDVSLVYVLMFVGFFVPSTVIIMPAFMCISTGVNVTPTSQLQMLAIVTVLVVVSHFYWQPAAKP